MADDDKLSIKEALGGIVVGSGVGYGASAVSGRKLKDVKFTDLIKEPAEKALAGITSFAEASEKMHREHNIVPADMSEAFENAVEKMAEKLGIDPGNVLTQMEMTGAPGKSFKDTAGAGMEAVQEVFTKMDKVGNTTKMVDDFKKIYAEELATIIGKDGAEKEKFIKEYAALGEKELRSVAGAVENSARKFVGAVKYEKASWYEKPLVAFEAMSTKGKIGMGALVLGTSMGAAYLLNHVGGKEDPAATR